MLIAVGLAAIGVLTLATGYFVAQEFAFVAVDRGRLKVLAERGDVKAARALRVTSRLSFMLSGAQLGITVTGLLTGYVAEPSLGRGLAELLGLSGMSRALSVSLSVLAALVVATVVQMVLGELAPKNLAIAQPEVLARALARSTLIYLAIAGPVIRVFDATANRLLRLVGIEPIEELHQGATTDDLDRIIESSREQGRLDEDTARLLENGLDFRDRTAGEAMVPRVDVVCVPATDSAARVVSLLETGHSRFPVVGDSVDDLLGVVSVTQVRDLDPAVRASTPIRDITIPPLLVPDSLPLPRALERLRAEHRQMAFVVDEHGGFAGILTLEDIAEELVGEIHDEDDVTAPGVVRSPDGSWLVPGRWRLDEVEGATGVRLPGSDLYETVAGLLMTTLGRLARPGDEVTVRLPDILGPDSRPVPAGTATLRVEHIRNRVPHIVRIVPSGRRGAP